MIPKSYSVSDSFRLLVEPGSLTEVRALFKSKECPDETVCRNQYYFGREHEKLAADIRKFDNAADCVGIYFVTGSINPELYGRNQSKWRPAFETKITSSKKEDVVRRKLLLIDCDSNRPQGQSATESERAEAFQLARDVVYTLETLGLASPIVGDSGNGCHIIYPIDLPANEESEQLVKEFLSRLSERCFSSGAKVDPVTWDSQRMVRLYGTHSRKGESTPERPHRMTGIIASDLVTQKIRESNSKAIKFCIDLWREQDPDSSSHVQASPIDLAKKYLEKVDPAIAGSNGSAVTFRAAITMVEGFALSEEDALGALSEWNEKCQPPWSERDLRHKISDAIKKVDQSRLGHLLKRNPEGPAKSEPTSPPAGKSDATIADLIKLNKSRQWIWPNWIQRGVLVGIAAEPGCGKTRSCADLVKRITLGMEWPDGSPPTLDPNSKIIWICCDNQWGEVAEFPEQFGFPADSVYLNAWNDSPTDGTVFDEAKHFKELEDRIIRTGAQLVLIDTVMNSTTHNTMRPEDGIKYFVPLANIAQRTNTTVILVTHLSSTGEPLGRRISGQVRQFISIERIEGDTRDSPRRKMFISKSNSIFPPELEFELKTNGSDFNLGTKPPEPPKEMDAYDWGMKFSMGGKCSKQLAIYIAKCIGYTDEDISNARARHEG